MQVQLRRLLPLLAAFAAALVLTPAGAQPVEEVPFITSPDNVTLEMLQIARVGSGDHVIDLGSGDGRIVITAARRFGATGTGVEIVPDLVQQSRRHARDAGVADRVSFHEQDLFQTDLSKATVVTMYLLPDVNLKLRPALLDLAPGTRVVSHDWDLGDWKPDQTVVVPVADKKVGLEKSSRIHLWVVPARVEGLWCSSHPAAGPGTLRLWQRFQEVSGELARERRVSLGAGRMEGDLLRLRAGEGDARAMVLRLVGDQLQLAEDGGRFQGTPLFRRARGGRCPG
jgi:SAM-dependent methyltransferase